MNRIKNLIEYNLLNNKAQLYQFLRYLVVGGSSASLELFLIYIFTDWINLFYLYSSISSFLLVAVYGFFFQKYFTFRNKSNNFHTQFSLFFIMVLIGLSLNTFFVYIFVEWLNIYYVIAKAFAISIVLIWNFLSQKFIVFK